LLLLLGAGASVYGQHEEGKEEKPQERAEPQQHAQPQQRAPQPKPQAQQPREKAQPQEKEKAAQPAQLARQPKQLTQPPARQAKQPQEKPQQQQQRPASKAPAQHPQTAQRQQPAQQSKPSAFKANYAPPQRTRQQAQTWQQKNGWQKDGAWQEHASWQQDRSSNWQADHRTWAQRGGYGGYYIPQASFGLHFGVGNWFRIQSEPVIVGGYPRFQYGGYSFLMVDPWPGDWAPNWYSADDVYVGFDNGYYLYNRQYPGEAIAITVVL
jgi:hypothetical protein